MDQINIFRKKLTGFLTSGISQPKKNLPEIKAEDVKKVLVCRPNHRLGNQLLITPLVEELSERFPKASIDIFVKGGVSHALFKNHPQIGKIISLPKEHFKNLGSYFWSWVILNKNRYDLIINFTSGSSSGRLSTRISRGKVKLFGDEYPDLLFSFEDYRHLAKQPIYNLRRLLKIEGDQIIPNLNIRLSTPELEKGKELLSEHAGAGDKIISIFTYATGLKCYPPHWWQNFYEKLKMAFSEYVILEILPVENVSQINFSAPTFYSQDLREIASVIAESSVFIGADSGMMHLASASQTPTIGLFHVTNLLKYQPYSKNSSGIETNKLNHDQLIEVIREKLAVAKVPEEIYS